MKTTYAQNNTRSLFVIVASTVLALVLFAALLGLSDKPEVQTVVFSSGDEVVAVPASSAASVQEDDVAEGDPSVLDAASTTTLQPIPDDADAAVTQPAAAQPTAVPATAVPVAPTVEPTPTEVPEIAPAVEPLPTSLPASQAADDSTGDTAEVAPAAAAAAAATVATAVDPTGTLAGNFFTRADEDEGATVSRNEVMLTFDDSGGGTFRGVLDITYANGSQVQIDMQGDFVYAAAPPQVMSTVNGTYRRDALDDLEDVTTDSGDLSITSFISGSGALCTPTCFGFTFPPPGT